MVFYSQGGVAELPFLQGIGYGEAGAGGRMLLRTCCSRLTW
jgi:hypothetical protein